MRPAVKRVRGTFALVALALLASAGSAHAGTARMVALPEEPRDDGPAEYFDYAAPPGESNRLEINGRPNGASIVVTDQAGIQPGRGCRRITAGDPTRVRCAAAKDASMSAADIAVGDRPDFVRVESGLGLNPGISGGAGDDDLVADGALAGGQGNDVLTGSGFFTGGPGDDVMTVTRLPDELDLDPRDRRTLDRLFGPPSGTFDESRPGNGSDTIVGGKSQDDTVDYSGRGNPVRVDLDGDRDDGEAGENDQVGAGIERIQGGRGDDELAGNEADNVLTGNGGSDTLVAGRGDDRLIADVEDLSEPLLARGSAPAITDKAQVLDAGAGADRLTGSGGTDELLPGSGRDVVQGFGGADRIAARDRSPDRIVCGRGPDQVAADRRDFFIRDCERIRRQGLASAVPLSLAGHLTVGPDVEVGCPIDGPRRCVGTLSIVDRGRRRARRGFEVPRGRVVTVRIRKVMPKVGVTRPVRLVARSRDRAGRVRTVVLETKIVSSGL